MCGCEGEEAVCVCVGELDCVATHAIDMAGERQEELQIYKALMIFHDHDDH